MRIVLKNGLKIGDQGTVFDPETGDTFTLNDSGHLILQKMQEGFDLDQVFDHLKGEYELDRNDFNRMVLDFKAMMRSFQLLQDE